MAPSRSSLKRSLLVSAFVALSLFSASAVAQNNRPSATTSSDEAATTATPAATTDGPTTGVISATDTSSATTTRPVTVPKISGSSSSSSRSGAVKGLPTLSKTADTAIPTYPAASVPPTQNAPFMQQSTLPQGTVFIAVGAILGAFGAAILLWRGIVACLLHRSVERATMEQHAANDKAAFPAPPAPFYKYSDRASSPNLIAPGRGQRRTQRGPTPSATPSQTNLFFSPTAASTGGPGGSNRDSRFLPSGFYAASSPSPVPGHGHSISLSNLRPDSRGQERHSPSESPALGPRTTPTPGQRNVSTSSLSMQRPPSGRAPSAFLDDLLDENPHMFPPAGPPHHGHHHNYSHSSLGRYS